MLEISMDTFNTKEALVASVTLDICSSSCAWNLQASGNFKKKRHEQKHILAMSPDAEGAARSQQGQKTIVQSIFPNSTCPWGLEQLLPLLPQCMHLSVLLGWLDMQTVSVRSQRSIGWLVGLLRRLVDQREWDSLLLSECPIWLLHTCCRHAG